MRNSLATRFAAALGAVLIVGAATPQTAAAEVPNIWSRWYSEVLDRNAKWEVPLAVIASIPAMILITPIWASQLALESMEDEEEAYDDDE